MANPTAVCPGTFDPITNGHLSVIRRAASLFSHVIVAVATEADKAPLFDLDARLALCSEACREWSHVEVQSFRGLIVAAARDWGAQVLVRGLRAVSDFELELQMAAMNRRLAPEIDTVFLGTDPEYMFLSSHLVREVALLGGNVGGLVPEHVEQALRRVRDER
jgi:pantetheine-phosphate adenylyltransferase